MIDLVIEAALENIIVGMYDPPGNIWIAGMVLGDISETVWRSLLQSLRGSCSYWSVSYYQGYYAVRFPRNKLDIDVIRKVFPDAIASKEAKAFLLPAAAYTRLEYLTGSVA